jgi:hypothetical protein
MASTMARPEASSINCMTTTNNSDKRLPEAAPYNNQWEASHDCKTAARDTLTIKKRSENHFITPGVNGWTRDSNNQHLVGSMEPQQQSLARQTTEGTLINNQSEGSIGRSHRWVASSKIKQEDQDQQPIRSTTDNNNQQPFGSVDQFTIGNSNQHPVGSINQLQDGSSKRQQKSITGQKRGLIRGDDRWTDTDTDTINNRTKTSICIAHQLAAFPPWQQQL